MSEKEKKEEKITFTIQGKEYELNGKYAKVNDNMGNIDITFDDENKPKISFNLLGTKNTNVEVKKVRVHKVFQGRENFINVVTNIFPANNQRISFKIGDVENKNIEAISIYFDATYAFVDTINLKKSQKISFKIGDINYQNIEVKSISFYNTTRIKYIYLAQGIRNEFYYKKSKYQLLFQSEEMISFHDNGELSSDCITNSIYRVQEIERQEQQQLLNKLENKTDNLENKTNNLENEQKKLADKHSVATWVDWAFVLGTGCIGGGCLIFALGLCFGEVIFPFNCILPEDFDEMSFDYDHLNEKHETFNRYVFFFEILKRAPIVVSIILGFKFLQLAFERLRLIGEVEKVQKYLNLAQGDNVKDVKNNLLSIIAIPFFAPKKVKSSFFDRLIDKTSINIGSERENSGVISKDKQNPD